MLQNLSVFHKELKKLMINFMRGSGGRGVLTPLQIQISFKLHFKKNSQKYACPPPSKNLSNRRTPSPPPEKCSGIAHEPHMEIDFHISVWCKTHTYKEIVKSCTV